MVRPGREFIQTNLVASAGGRVIHADHTDREVRIHILVNQLQLKAADRSLQHMTRPRDIWPTTRMTECQPGSYSPRNGLIGRFSTIVQPGEGEFRSATK